MILNANFGTVYQLSNEESHEQGYTEGYGKGYADGIQESVEDGKQQQYNEFWDSFQNNGKEYNYQYAFAGYQWNDTNFKPKYDIVIGAGYTGTNMFWSCPVTNIAESLERQGVRLDTTNCGYFSSMFQNAVSTRIPEINATHAMDYNGNGLHNTFLNANVETIDKLVVVENVRFVSTFNGCTNLKNIVFEGVIGQDINLQWSTKLTHDSLMSAINTLKDYSADTSGTVHTITLGADNIAKLTGDELLMITNKRWQYG